MGLITLKLVLVVSWKEAWISENGSVWGHSLEPCSSKACGPHLAKSRLVVLRKRILGFFWICLLKLCRTKEKNWKSSYWGSAVTWLREPQKGENWEANKGWSCIWGMVLIGFTLNFFLIHSSIYRWLHLGKSWICFQKEAGGMTVSYYWIYLGDRKIPLVLVWPSQSLPWILTCSSLLKALS